MQRGRTVIIPRQSGVKPCWKTKTGKHQVEDDCRLCGLESGLPQLAESHAKLLALNAELLVTLKRIWATQVIKDYPLAIKIDKLFTAAEGE